MQGAARQRLTIPRQLREGSDRVLLRRTGKRRRGESERVPRPSAAPGQGPGPLETLVGAVVLHRRWPSAEQARIPGLGSLQQLAAEHHRRSRWQQSPLLLQAAEARDSCRGSQCPGTHLTAAGWEGTEQEGQRRGPWGTASGTFSFLLGHLAALRAGGGLCQGWSSNVSQPALTGCGLAPMKGAWATWAGAPPHHARCSPYSLGRLLGPQEGGSLGGARGSRVGLRRDGHPYVPDSEVMASLSSQGVCPRVSSPCGGHRGASAWGTFPRWMLSPLLWMPWACWAVPLNGEAGFIGPFPGNRFCVYLSRYTWDCHKTKIRACVRLSLPRTPRRDVFSFLCRAK